MVRMSWIICLLLIPQAEDDGAALLKAVQDRVQKAKSLRVGVAFAFSESGTPTLAFSGEVRANGPNQWLVDFTSNKGDGLEEQFRGSCDGLNVGMKGFGEQPREAHEPERYARQLREWSATSFIPVFFSLIYKKLDQGKNNFPTVSGVKSLGREKVGAIEARVVEYVLTYPTNSKAQIKAWIDPVRLLPLKRGLRNVRGGGIVETLASFEIDPDTPEATFVTPNPTEADKAIARLRNKGRRQIMALGQALEDYQEKEGQYPTTAEGLDALLNKPKGAKNWKGPYLEEGELLKDPWGNAYAYRSPGLRDPARYDLSSPVFEEKYKLPLERLKELLAADDREASVVAALKAILNAEMEFRSKDLDGNGVTDFWVGDISGLYRYLAVGGEIRLIPRGIAEADAAALKIKELSKEWPEKPIPYQGYLFSVFSKHVQEGKVKPYHTGNFRNADLFGVVAYPADYPKSGRYTLIIDGNLNILRCDLGGKTIDTSPPDDDPHPWRLPTGD